MLSRRTAPPRDSSARDSASSSGTCARMAVSASAGEIIVKGPAAGLHKRKRPAGFLPPGVSQCVTTRRHTATGRAGSATCLEHAYLLVEYLCLGLQLVLNGGQLLGCHGFL